MEWDGLFVETHRDVYEPSDDTFLLARVVADAVSRGDRFLEVGCGAGLVSLVAARAGARVVCTDMNPGAVDLTRSNAERNGLEVEAHQADLFEGFASPFDIVAFNPPYLPTAADDHVEGLLDLAFDGGEDGNAVVLRFADAISRLPDPPREVLVVHSDLSDPVPLQAAMARLQYRHEVAARERHCFEELWVRRFAFKPGDQVA